MALIPWKPFSDLDKFFDEEDWFFPVIPKTEITKPAMDIYETDKDVVAELSIPDFDPDKINVSVENGVLQVSGKMDKKEEEKKKGYWRKEIRKGSFERMVRLPVAVNESKASAVYENGVLKITIPKAKKEIKKKAQIKVKKKK